MSEAGLGVVLGVKDCDGKRNGIRQERRRLLPGGLPDVLLGDLPRSLLGTTKEGMKNSLPAGVFIDKIPDPARSSPQGLPKRYARLHPPVLPGRSAQLYPSVLPGRSARLHPPVLPSRSARLHPLGLPDHLLCVNSLVECVS
ncbi:hypothetical protein Dimus_000900 [Dionaea muscipula]